MKTSVGIFLCLGLFANTAYSQGWRIAPTMGLNVSAITYSSVFRNGLNSSTSNTRTGLLARFQIGAYLDYAFSDRLSIRSGLLYTGKGGSLHLTASQYGVTQSATGSYKFDYLEIPLLLNIAIGNDNYRLVGGPVVGVTLNGKATVTGGYYYGYGYFTGNVTNFRIGTGLSDQILPIDLSASLGIVKELELGDRPLEIGLHVQPSFSNWNTVSKTQPDYYGRNLLVGLRIAYLFELGH